MTEQMMKGNTAVIIGAMYGGCDCFFGYPITPASEILHEASKYFPMVGRNFVQAESEEASINMVYGASSTGHRVMTASSGPGISLMQEAITYLAGAELPSVIVDIMRAGPGLGNIGPEQGDYNQVVKGGGHGNYKNIVLAPNSVQEMCDFTIKAFELADKYKSPVFVLADATLGQMAEPLKFPIKAIEHVSDNSWSVRGNEETMKNLVTSIYLDFDQLEEFNNKLQKKYEIIEKEEVEFEEYLTEDADIILIAYGISSRISKTAVDFCRKHNIKVGLFRPITLYPNPYERLNQLKTKYHQENPNNSIKFISVEMSNGQMAEDIKLTIKSDDVELVNRMGGNLIEIGDIINKIAEITNNKDLLESKYCNFNKTNDDSKFKGFKENEIDKEEFRGVID
ncbi:MAG: 3-methyl-2-oxobutanoate dehydrogenase subunit VorB [Methanobrevibacter sp.]|jgi:2-oxoisovalerate ferredoxin oxidoreductase alpha subunit|nr:3-methyl-2-oxobutanoate dehydrogenase subunit VorB [Candidatus Methanoflexus mossambicus]